MKQSWKDYFSFNKRQRNGVFVLLTLIALMLVILIFIDYVPLFSNPAPDFSAFKKEIDNATRNYDSSESKSNVSGSVPGKVNINTADAKQLSTINTMPWYLAKVIVNYRTQHGKYQNIEELHNIIAVNDSIYNKISPFLKVGD